MDPITIDRDDDGNIIVHLPSGHEETLTQEEAELLGFALLNETKDVFE